MTLSRWLVNVSAGATLLCTASAVQALSNAGTVDPQMAPYIAAVQISEDSYCSGVILNATTVLLDPACVHLKQDVTVITGEHHLWMDEGTEVSYQAQRAIVHPDFIENGYGHELALLKLSSPIQLNDTAQSIAISSTTPASGTTGVIYGWGAVSKGSQYSDELREAPQTVTGTGACEAVYGEFGMKMDNRLCIADSPYRACVGDGGAPLVIDGKLAGMFIYDFPACESGNPAVFLDLSKYKSWIEANL